MTNTDQFLERIQQPFFYRLYLLRHLPSAFFAGLRIQYADVNKAVVRVPYKWFTKNPFRSTYFACLSMAAEMSTGILAMAHLSKKEPKISMLVVNLEAIFLKKATGKTLFECEDGLLIEQTIKEAAASGKATLFKARSIGTDANGDIVAEFNITWSFKAKGQPSTVKTPI